MINILINRNDFNVICEALNFLLEHLEDPEYESSLDFEDAIGYSNTISQIKELQSTFPPKQES